MIFLLLTYGKEKGNMNPLFLPNQIFFMDNFVKKTMQALALHKNTCYSIEENITGR